MREGKGHKGTWQHVSFGPSLRSASPLRFEDVLVGRADGFLTVAALPVLAALGMPIRFA